MSNSLTGHYRQETMICRGGKTDHLEGEGNRQCKWSNGKKYL